MKLSDKTLTLLKNFSNINQSIIFKKGSSLRTISVMKNILAEATIDEDLPKDFGIYDLGQFLNGMGLHHSPELDFQDDDSYVVIKEGRMKSKYFFADPNVIVTPPDKEITLPSTDVSFELSTQQLDKLLKAAAIYQLPDLSAVGETESTFSFNFKVENIKILPGSYNVVANKSLALFTCQNYELKYYIALEPDSTFG